MTMLILHLPLAVFSFSEQFLSFALAPMVRIIVHYFRYCLFFFYELKLVIENNFWLSSVGRNIHYTYSCFFYFILFFFSVLGEVRV